MVPIKIMVIAPHLEYPPRNGGDIYVDRLACHLSVRAGRVAVLGMQTLTLYENGTLLSQQHFKNRFRPKLLAAFRAMVLGTHYLVEKLLTDAYRLAAVRITAENPDSLIVYSYISSASLDLPSRAAVVLTQNDEIAFYRNQRAASRNPLHKLTAYVSEKWVSRFLDNNSRKYVYAHISEQDCSAYQQYMPAHKCFVVPAGVDLRPLPPRADWSGMIQLLFCGSLGTKMNVDALLFFRDRFWPDLAENFEKRIGVWIAGSNPTAAVRQVCDRQGWQLFPNIGEDSLRELLGRATFGILPFPYTAGAKLKLLNFLEVGLPVLATNNMRYRQEQEFFPNLYSDAPLDWLRHLERIAGSGVSPGDRAACRQYASRFTWDSSALALHRGLVDLEL